MTRLRFPFFLLTLGASCLARPGAAQPHPTAVAQATPVADNADDSEDDGSNAEPSKGSERTPAPVAFSEQSRATGVAPNAQSGTSTSRFKQQRYVLPVQDTHTLTTETRWYGWETLLCDVAALGILVLGAGAESAELGVGSLGVYALGGPIVHAAHGNLGRAAGSLGLRLVTPVVGAEIMSAGKSGWDALGGALTGASIGVLTAVVLDSVWLARERVEVQKPVIAPTLALTRSGASVGMAGVF